jgi:hypothetical protein
MSAPLEPYVPSKAQIWAGRVITTLVVLFLLFDCITKILQVPAVLEASAKNGFSPQYVMGIGITLLACVVLYVIPRTAVMGAILLTGYLGGATEANFHVGLPPALALMPVVIGVLVWAGLWPREPRLRELLPLRR